MMNVFAIIELRKGEITKRSSDKFNMSGKSVASKLHTKGDSRWKQFLK